MSLSQSNSNVVISFVLPEGYESKDSCSEDMIMAFQTCLDQDLCPDWIKEEEALRLKPTEQNVIVFEKFSGKAFNYLKQFKCVIVGARCILTCLIEGIPIPDGKSPVFTIAMNKLIITTTGFNDLSKNDLVEKMEYMGAVYSKVLMVRTTHVVSNSACSMKHTKAVEKGIPVMTDKWVYAVWEASLTRNVRATDEEFMVYKCPIFHNLSVSCSGLSKSEREQIKDLITQNGGECTGTLESGRTNVLILNEPAGQKYKHAVQWKISCVKPSWVYESIKKGFIVSPEEHEVNKKSVLTSTPEKDESKFLPNFSTLSSICDENDATHINETVSSEDRSKRNVYAGIRGEVNSNVIRWMKIIDDLILKDVKKAGAFLDGCKVYISGFNTERTEKLRRILNGGGATRFNEITDSVTHILIGEHVQTDMAIIKSLALRPHIVNVDWLVESMKLKCPAPEDLYAASEQQQQQHPSHPRLEPPSPLSKKGLQLLQKPTSLPQLNLEETTNKSDVKNDDTDLAHNLVEEYLQAKESGESGFTHNSKLFTQEDNLQTCAEPDVHFREEDTFFNIQKPDTKLSDTTVTEASESSQCSNIFKGLTFAIAGFNEEDTSEYDLIIKECGGRVAKRGFKGIPDFGIVPIQGAKLHLTTSEVVTHLWIYDCCEKEELVPILFYHKPVQVDLKIKPLKDCVIGTSTYIEKDKDFIIQLARLLGARTQEELARVNCESKNIRASTHLICPEPGSQKYHAACKWKLPTVNHEWLLACAKEGRHVDEKPYLIKALDTKKKYEESLRLSMKSVSCRTSNLPSELATLNEVELKENVSIDSKEVQASQASQPYPDKRISMGPPDTPSSRRQKDRSTPKRKSICMQASSYASPINTPTRDNPSASTPVNAMVQTPLSSPAINHAGWPAELNQATPKPPSYMLTPETPYGQAINPDPSPNTRKKWKKWIDNLPEFEKDAPPPKKRRDSTPLSEIKLQIWKKFGGIKTPPQASTSHNQENETEMSIESYPKMSHGRKSEEGNVRSPGINTQLNELQEVLAESAGSTVVRNSSSTSDDSRPKSESIAPNSLDIQAGYVEWIDPTTDGGDSAKEGNSSRPIKFMFSAVDNAEHYEKIILKLGGVVSSNQTFDPSATHLVCGKPGRSEKILSSIASGKWVLYKSYLDECEKTDTFVPEEPHEWGNPAATEQSRGIQKDSIQDLLAKAAHRWRCKIKEKGSGAFFGMRALVYASKDKTESFSRLIKAGGGETFESSSGSELPQDITHCFIEMNKTKQPINLNEFAHREIPCLPPIYLSNFLVNDPPPDPLDCLIPEFRSLVKKLKS